MLCEWEAGLPGSLTSLAGRQDGTCSEMADLGLKVIYLPAQPSPLAWVPRRRIVDSFAKDAINDHDVHPAIIPLEGRGKVAPALVIAGRIPSIRRSSMDPRIRAERFPIDLTAPEAQANARFVLS